MSIETLDNYRQLEVMPVLAKIKKLQVSRPYRDRKKLFFAEGIRNFVDAVDHQFSIDTIIYSEKLLICPIARKLVRKLKREATPFARVTPEQFRSISLTERASGVGAIFRQQWNKLNEIDPSKHISWTVLNQICALGNLGTLIRTSAASGASGFIFLGDQIDPFDPKVVRATMGAMFKQRFIKTNTQELYNWINFYKLNVVGASPNGLVDYNQTAYVHPTILMLGNERSGLSQEQLSMCQKIVRIPMAEGTDSLNVAVAGSLLLYEVFRSSLQKQIS
jgi:TrmH family RNA methyltransferase